MSEMWISMVKPTVISTFAGCGGSSLGYKLAGYKELLAIEWDNNTIDTFKLNFPGIPVYHGDISKLTSKECMKLAGIKKRELDILDGSPPCQGFSITGKRKFDDPRNSLFIEYVRLLNDLQPKIFIMENVTGMVKGYMKQVYLQIVKTLRECGYKVKGQIMNAMYYNVPQSRERVIIIGVREDLGIEPSHPKPQNKPIKLREAIKDIEYKGIELKGNLLKISKYANPGEDFGKVYIKMGGRKYKYFSTKKLKWNKVCNTLTTIVGANYTGLVLPDEDNFLSIHACKRISSFPDNFQFNGTYKEQWAGIGNSVPPNMMKAIAEYIKTNILEVVKQQESNYARARI